MAGPEDDLIKRFTAIDEELARISEGVEGFEASIDQIDPAPKGWSANSRGRRRTNKRTKKRGAVSIGGPRKKQGFLGLPTNLAPGVAANPGAGQASSRLAFGTGSGFNTKGSGGKAMFTSLSGANYGKSQVPGFKGSSSGFRAIKERHGMITGGRNILNTMGRSSAVLWVASEITRNIAGVADDRAEKRLRGETTDSDIVNDIAKRFTTKLQEGFRTTFQNTLSELGQGFSLVYSLVGQVFGGSVEYADRRMTRARDLIQKTYFGISDTEIALQQSNQSLTDKIMSLEVVRGKAGRRFNAFKNRKAEDFYLLGFGTKESLRSGINSFKEEYLTSIKNATLGNEPNGKTE